MAKSPTPKGPFRVLVGINYRPSPRDAEKRAEPGDVVTDVPAEALEWMLEQKILEPDSAKGSGEPTAKPKGDAA